MNTGIRPETLRKLGISKMPSKFDSYNKMRRQAQLQYDQLTGNRSNLTRRLQEKKYTEPDSEGDITPEGYRKFEVNQYTPDQTELFKSLFEHVSPDSYLSRLASGDEELFDEMEAPALRKFNQLQGNLASRFSGMGLGARKSSGFQNEANEFTSQFAQDLASRRQELQRQAILDLQGLSRELLGQRPYDRGLVKKQYPQQQPDKSGDLLGGLLSGLAGGATGYATGGFPAAIAGGAGGFYRGYSGGY